jgi:hypothetical protein
MRKKSHDQGIRARGVEKVFLMLVTIGLFQIGTVGNSNASNIALNSTVTLNGGTFFTSGTWSSPSPAGPETLVDGVFLDLGHQWNQDTVFWDSHTEQGQYIQFDLGGSFVINSFIAQVDDNDAYTLSFWDATSSSWQTAWDIPNYDSGYWGMTTRPDPHNNLMAFSLPNTITTNALRLEGNYNNGDDYFAVSEIQAFGERAPVPEPATMLLFGTGLVGLVASRRKKKRN